MSGGLLDLKVSALDLKSPASPISSALKSDKAAVVFPSHVRRTFQRFPTDYTGELVRLLDDITTVTHSIAAYVTEGSEKVLYGSVGDITEGLDAAVATKRLYGSLSRDGYACLFFDKNTEAPLTMPEDAPHGSYVVMCSPLDTEPNSVEQAICGTIFSVYKRRSPASLPGRLMDLQQKLGDQVAAGYVLYSSATTLFYTLGGQHGAYSFCLHPVATQYFLQPSHALRIPPGSTPIIYAERSRLKREAVVGKIVGDWAANCEPKPAKMFDTGTLCGNFNEISLRGGIVVHFDCHLLCEAGPLALLIEQLGGKAINETGRRILDMDVDDPEVHQKVTLIAGSAGDVDKLANELKQYE